MRCTNRMLAHDARSYRSGGGGATAHRQKPHLIARTGRVRANQISFFAGFGALTGRSALNFHSSHPFQTVVAISPCLGIKRCGVCQLVLMLAVTCTRSACVDVHRSHYSLRQPVDPSDHGCSRSVYLLIRAEQPGRCRRRLRRLSRQRLFRLGLDRLRRRLFETPAAADGCLWTQLSPTDSHRA